MSAPLVLYDGLCGFCDASVQWVLQHDRDGVFRFAPLQGETAATMRARFPQIPSDVDTIVLVDDDGAWLRSAAVFRICARLPGAWRGLSWLGVLPGFLTDLGYRFVARIRYRIWGRRDSCRIPTAETRARFLP
jgi:predicted DCC family thiol-disulfide oxidoreductase YuxK